MINSRSLDMIQTVAAGLGALLDKFVFVGGASTCLHIDDPAAQGVRPTDDVDCVVNVVTRGEYSELEEKLRTNGFSHVMEPGHPICRWRYKGIFVDVMPDNPEIVGFSSNWYRDGCRYAKQIQLPSGLTIKCFTLPYFLASKIEAYEARGADCRLSQDIEDIVLVLDGKLEYNELLNAPGAVAGYLRAKFSWLLSKNDFIESVHCHLPPDPGNIIRARRILDCFLSF